MAVGCFLGAYYVGEAWAAAALVVLGIAVPVRTARFLEGHGFWPARLRVFR